MQATEGLVRGQEVKDTGAPIMVPVGPGTLGRILNVIGEPVDEQGNSCPSPHLHLLSILLDDSAVPSTFTDYTLLPQDQLRAIFAHPSTDQPLSSPSRVSLRKFL